MTGSRDACPRGACPRASTTRRGRAAATSTTGGSATGCGRSAGRSTSTRSAGDWPRPDAATWPGCSLLLAALPDGAVVLVDGLVASAAAGGAGRPRRRGCGSWCWCTCRSATALPAERDAVLRSAARRGHHQRLDARRRSARYGLAPRGPRRPARASTRPPLAARDGDRRRRCCASPPSPRQGPGPRCSTRCAGSPTGRGRCVCAGSLDVDPDHVDALQAQVYAHSGIGDRVTLRRSAGRRRARGGVRRRRPGRAAVAGRDLRHGRDRGAGPRAAGGRDRGRRRAGGARPRRRRHVPGPAGRARTTPRAGRGAARAGSTTPACARLRARRPARRRPAGWDRTAADSPTSSPRSAAVSAPTGGTTMSRRHGRPACVGPGRGSACVGGAVVLGGAALAGRHRSVRSRPGGSRPGRRSLARSP